MAEVRYIDRGGELHEPDAVDKMWRMEKLQVTYACPHCGREETAIVDSARLGDATDLCHACDKEYRLNPLFHDDDATLEERVEQQMESVAAIDSLVFGGRFRTLLYLSVISPRII